MSTRDHPDWWRPMGGQNSQDSTLERRSTIWNDGDPVAPAAPPNWHLGIAWYGKFFTRGMRSIPHRFGVYCTRAAAGTLDLSFSPHPCLGPLYTITITPGAAWAWAWAVFHEMWNYDSLFIWVSRCDVDVSYGFDAVQPQDAHITATAGAAWTPLAFRLYIRVDLRGETPGDVPVSGTVNTIEIPSVGSEMAADTIAAVPSNVVTTICIAEGAGTLLEARLDFYTSVTPTAGVDPPAVRYQLRLTTEDGIAGFTDNRDLTQSCVATSGRSSKGEFWQCTVQEPEYDRTFMRVRLPIKFRRRLTLQAVHTTGVNVRVTGSIYANVIK